MAFAPADRHAETRLFGDELFDALAHAPRPAQASAPTEIITEPFATASDHPAQSWESLRAHARSTPRIWPEPASANKAQRGMGARPGSPQHRYRQGDRLRLVIDSDWEGHLLLLDEGPEGIIYCLCPSLFAPDTCLRRERHVLPQAGARYEAFELSGNQLGRENLLAIVSDAPLGLDWLPRDAHEPARVLNQADIGALLMRLRELDQSHWTALSSYFEIVN